MAHIRRESSAPISDGETASAADVENEFVKIFNAINGGIDTTNIAATAGILGTQLANGTVTASKIATSTITTAQMAATAVTKANFATALSVGSMTTSTSMVDLDDVSSITLTPGSTSDIVIMELQISWKSSLSNSFYDFGFNIDDGTGDVVVATGFRSSTSTITSSYRHVMTATAASSTVYKARYQKVTGNTGVFGTGVDHTTMFSVVILPIK